jgi:hypothetical protein
MTRFSVVFPAYDDADEWTMVLQVHDIDAEQRGKTVYWLIDLTARAPRNPLETAWEARAEHRAAFAAVVFPPGEAVFSTWGSVAADAFTNPVERRRLLAALRKLHEFVDILLSQLLGLGTVQAITELPYSERN